MPCSIYIDDLLPVNYTDKLGEHFLRMKIFPVHCSEHPGCIGGSLPRVLYKLPRSVNQVVFTDRIRNNCLPIFRPEPNERARANHLSGSRGCKLDGLPAARLAIRRSPDDVIPAGRDGKA